MLCDEVWLMVDRITLMELASGTLMQTLLALLKPISSLNKRKKAYTGAMQKHCGETGSIRLHAWLIRDLGRRLDTLFDSRVGQHTLAYSGD